MTPSVERMSLAAVRSRDPMTPGAALRWSAGCAASPTISFRWQVGHTPMRAATESAAAAHSR